MRIIRSIRSRQSFRQTITAWTAIFAVLMMVIAPTVSRALSAERGAAFWMEICSVYSDKAAGAADQDEGENRSPSSLSSSYCPYCVMHADIVTPPLQAAVADTVFSMSHLLPRLFYRAPQPLFAWTVALSRAPPAAI